MIKIVLIVLLVISLTAYALYLLGKKVKEQEKILLRNLKIRKSLNDISLKRKRQSTPKVPTIKK